MKVYSRDIPILKGVAERWEAEAKAMAILAYPVEANRLLRKAKDLRQKISDNLLSQHNHKHLQKTLTKVVLLGKVLSIKEN